MQEELDAFILKNNKCTLSKRELLTDTLLALSVEVAELANATRCFKHWSMKESESRERLLDEYADIMHFQFSIGNQLGFTPQEIEAAYINKYKENVRRQNTGY